MCDFLSAFCDSISHRDFFLYNTILNQQELPVFNFYLGNPGKHMQESRFVAVITGAASGIGLALVKACITRQFDVIMVDIDKLKLDDQVNQLNGSGVSDIVGIECDVRSVESVKQLAAYVFKQFNRVDLLINNAGISGTLAPIWEQTPNQVKKVIDINLHGVVHGVHVFLPYMFKQTHRSRVVNMASFYGLCSGSQMASYSMSKHAIVALSESMFFDLRRLNKQVDVSVVCPSFVNTSLLTNSSPSVPDKLHAMVSSLIERSRGADDIAEHILQEIDRNTFYILPDKEVKHYCEERTKAIIQQTIPYEHNLEKLIVTLSGRANA